MRLHAGDAEPLPSDAKVLAAYRDRQAASMRDVLEEYFAVSRALARPIAMFVDESDADAVTASIDAGVSSYVVDGLAPHRIRPILDLAVKRFNAFAQLHSDLAEALVCAAARETFEESGVLFAGPADDPDGIVSDATVYHESRAALESRELSFGEFLAREKLVLRADLLWPWANWITPKEERTRRYDTFFFVGALPAGQRAGA